jgi:signal transduction histidine kinase/ActR/RegA family two-component response regulator
LTSEHRDSRRTIGYLVALLACGMAAALEYLLQPLLGERYPLALFPAAVIVAAWFGGFGPGLAATLVAGLAAAYFFRWPIPQLPVDGPANAAAVLLFTLAGLLVSLAVRHLRTQARTEREARTDTERKLRQTDQLQQLTATVSRARTPAEVIRACLPELLHAIEAAAGAVFLVSDDGSACELAHAIGFGNAFTARVRRVPLVSTTLLANVIRYHELVVAESGAAAVFNDPKLSSDRDLNEHRGAVVVPLAAAGRTIGTIFLTFRGARPIEGDERDFLLSAGRHTAQALDRARLYEAAERSRAEAEAFRAQADSELRERQRAEEALRLSETRNRALAARTSRLYALSAGLSEAASVQAVAKAIVTHGKIVLGATGGSVVTIAENGTEFETVYAEESGQPNERPHRFRAERGLCATAVVETRRPVLVGSFAEWQDKYPQSASIAADGGFASTAALPLSADGSGIGVLSFSFTVPVNFDEDYTALLMSVAQHCAQALDRARSYESAERARADAEAANRSKDDFLSTISHELRTPLNAILGWAAMLRSGSIEPGRRCRAIEAIFDNATRQGRLIEELLDVSRIVAGRAALDRQDVNLSENIRGAVEAMMPSAAAKGVDLRFDVPPEVHVFADPRRLEQVFLNLLTNAVKFTPSGGHVHVEVFESAQSVQVCVVDDGAGIDPEFLPHVFERFRQADSTTKRSVGGLGLGLFIARHLVEAQEGTVRVESAGPGHGATFTVSLPAAASPGAVQHPPASDAASAEATPPEGMPLLAGVRVLLVDDEPDALEMMAAALETCGATVKAASSVRDAIETLGHTGIDVVLSDIAMPGQDGYELIREIRSMHTSAIASIPAAAVTACVRDDERERALAAGFQTHLAKPVQPIALAQTVATLARVGAERVAENSGSNAFEWPSS